ERRSQLVCLDKRPHQSLHILHAGPIAESSEGLGAGTTRSYFELRAHDLLVQRARATFRLLGYACQRSIEAHAGLDAHHQEIEHIGQSEQDLSLTLLDAIVEPKIRKEEPNHRQDQRDGNEVWHHAIERRTIEEVSGPKPEAESHLGADKEQERVG